MGQGGIGGHARDRKAGAPGNPKHASPSEESSLLDWGHDPAGSSPAIGRRRPDTIGGPADVEAVWSQYTSKAPLWCAPRQARRGLTDRLSSPVTSPQPVGVLARLLAPGLEALPPACVWPA
jgi:hypothetical protein